MSFNIIVRNYEHYNRSLGKYITSKRQYETEMAKQGYVSMEEGEKIAEKARENMRKPYVLSKKAKEVIYCAKNSADKKGKVPVSDKLVEGMKEVGVNFYQRNIPKCYTEGGFDAV